MDLKGFIKRLIHLAILAAILVMTKRRVKWLFWFFFVLLSIFLSPWLVLLIVLLFQIIICDFILGINVELIGVDWFVFPIWALTYLVTTPALYNAITLIEQELDGKPTMISASGKFLGFLWGLATSIFFLYRLGFFNAF